jgi:N-acyl-D-aspartate/D-glutamate deacylase
VDPVDLVYGALLEDGGRRLLYVPLFNFAHGNFDDIHEMISNPFSLFGLSDAGAHCGAICDASFPTSSLVVWARDRTRGPRLPVERLVHEQTQRTAAHVGWLDRGVVAPGYLADLNVIDLAALDCAPPHVVRDLPAGGRRLVQEARGYRLTVKSGVVTFEDGEHTGALPGDLLRGARPAPDGTQRSSGRRRPGERERSDPARRNAAELRTPKAGRAGAE